MPRIVMLVVERCDAGCPHFTTEDGFASHHGVCALLGLRTNEVDRADDPQYEATIKDWIENRCPLPQS